MLHAVHSRAIKSALLVSCVDPSTANHPSAREALLRPGCVPSSLVASTSTGQEGGGRASVEAQMQQAGRRRTRSLLVSVLFAVSQARDHTDAWAGDSERRACIAIGQAGRPFAGEQALTTQ